MTDRTFKRLRDLADRASAPDGFEYLRRKVPAALGRRIRSGRRRYLDRVGGSYPVDVTGGELRRRFSDPASWFAPGSAPGLADCCAAYVRGRFDLLGSDWVDATLGARSPGFQGINYAPGDRPLSQVNRSNAETSAALARLLPAGYRRLDWQRDLRSGYRWSEAMHASQIPIGHRPGADIKVPWELGKLQHLPRLALAYAAAMAGATGFELPETYRAAFRAQVIDFIAYNPPGFGVQWSTAMLAAIRGANLAIAYDLFRAAGAEFDADFDTLISQTLWVHGSSVVEGLEWWDMGVRNNHYLANIAGLAIVASYLPDHARSRSWRQLAAGELGREWVHQFQPDGTNFEGATGYHAFALDIMTWGLAFVADLRQGASASDPALLTAWPAAVRMRAAERTNRPPIAEWERALAFLEAVTDPQGALVQIGDNDSGRFVSLVPTWCARHQRERLLDYTPVMAAARALMGEPVEHPAARGIRDLLRGRRALDPSGDRSLADALSSTATTIRYWTDRAARAQSETLVVDVPDSVGAWTVTEWPHFGLVTARRPGVLLTIRCGPAAPRGDGGHEHDDQGSVHLYAGGQTLLRDPGTYIYTGAPEWRARLRGRGSHFAPCRQGDAHAVPASAFAALDTRRAHCHLISEGAVVLEVPGGLFRVVRLLPSAVEITDFTEHGAAPVSLTELATRNARQPWSDGYGRLAEGTSCVCGEVGA